uniref:E3 ubiquitin-protein ligase TRIM39-like n=1 Tax=Euleptes europaea TaxID=460621 RepID=UPI002540849B|nr:E3 ubiquitin-protein ligase TRIM39-like [Euleptes europaea]
MAAASPAKKLQDEVTCSICLDYLEDPVMIVECGHNFCRGCITENSKGSGCSASCPECRQLFSWENLKPNRQLGNIVETAKQLRLQLDTSRSDTESRCKAHPRPVAVAHFCKTDGRLLCETPGVARTEEAAAHYKDIGSTMDRCNKSKFQYPAVPDTSATMKMLSVFCQEGTSQQSSSGEWRENTWRPYWIKENVLLDPETAHPRYVVSPDWKSVSWGDVRQRFPYNEKRFQCIRCVLGCEGFTSGKHYWTVDVGDGDYWAVGVARESVEREEEIDLEPDEGIWAIGRYGDQYKALTSPPTLLEVEEEPTEIQVSLNYDAGIVHFYDGEDKTRLFKFQSVDFEEEEIFPFFRIVDSSTVLSLYS